MLTATRHSALRAARLSTVAQRRLASTLVFLEQKGGKLNAGSLSAVTAAKSIGGDVSRTLGKAHPRAGQPWIKHADKCAGVWHRRWLQG